MDIETVETWRPVVGYEGLYSVSSLGRVRSEQSGNIISRGDILNQRCREYLRVDLYGVGKVRTINVHRLVALAFLPTEPARPQVNHKNLDKLDNRADNLEWATHTENLRHARLSKPWVCGGRGGRRTLCTVQARIIRACARMDLPRGWRTEIARAFGVSTNQVSWIGLGKAWKHLP